LPLQVAQPWSSLTQVCAAPERQRTAPKVQAFLHAPQTLPLQKPDAQALAAL
jgi:hypothetical protein